MISNATAATASSRYLPSLSRIFPCPSPPPRLPISRRVSSCIAGGYRILANNRKSCLIDVQAAGETREKRTKQEQNKNIISISLYYVRIWRPSSPPFVAIAPQHNCSSLQRAAFLSVSRPSTPTRTSLHRLLRHQRFYNRPLF